MAAQGARIRLAAACVAMTVAVTQAAPLAQDWPQWRGPARDGSLSSLSNPTGWPAQLTRRWRVKVGTGLSSPVVSGQRIYLQSREGEQEVVQAIDVSTGTQVWRDEYPAAYTMHPAAMAHGRGPRSTPVLSGGRLFAFGVSGVMSGYDAHSGRLLWRLDTAALFDGEALEFGVSSSPIVAGGLLIVHVGNKKGGAVVALEPATGKERWRWSGDSPSYASPILADVEGTPQIVVLAYRSLVGLSPASGELLWQTQYLGDRYPHAVTPTMHGSTVVVSGSNLGTTAFRIAKDVDGWKAVRGWHNPDVSMSMSTPVVGGGFLYGLADKQRGQLVCIDARDGSTRWTSPGRGGDTAAILRADDNLLWFTSDGEFVIVKAGEGGYNEVKRYQIAEGVTWTVPAVLGRQIAVRDAEGLSLWVVP